MKKYNKPNLIKIDLMNNIEGLALACGNSCGKSPSGDKPTTDD